MGPGSLGLDIHDPRGVDATYASIHFHFHSL